MPHEHGKGFLADMVLNPLGIRMGSGVRDPKRLEEFDHDLMPAARFLGKPAARVR